MLDSFKMVFNQVSFAEDLFASKTGESTFYIQRMGFCMWYCSPELNPVLDSFKMIFNQVSFAEGLVASKTGESTFYIQRMGFLYMVL